MPMSETPSIGHDDAARPETTATEDPAGEHDTLKYHLLGPSLTKAGQDSVDQQKVRPMKVPKKHNASY